MKHYNSKLLLTLLLFMCATITSAHDIAVKNSDGREIYYNINSDGITLTVTYRGTSYNQYYNNYLGKIVIPETVTYSGKTYSVTSIGREAFRGCRNLTSVTIPNSVTSIGSYAFEFCTGLTSVTIPNSVTTIGEDAFYGTAWYNNQPKGLVYVGDFAYKYKGTMPANTSITLKEGTVGIASYAFYDCDSLTSVTIPNSVTKIGSYAFYKCSGLKKVIVPDIENWCSIKFGSSSDNPLYYAHHLYSDENTEITKLVIPDGVTSINSYAFYGCSGLTSVTIPSSVTSIGGDAFHGCSGLTSVTIGNSVTSIGSSAFSGCSGLTSLTIPNSVTSIGSSAFSRCSGLTSVTIGNSVTSIGFGAFEYCSRLTSVTIPNSVTSIGSYAFSGCSRLTSVTIPNSVTSIGNDAFSDCSRLTSVTIPNSVTSIGDRAFYNSGLKSVTIPNSVTSIGYSAFYKCSGLTSVTIPNSVTSIGYSAFEGCSGLTSVTIPNSVTSISEWAFSDCRGLKSVTIPNSVTSIGKKAFNKCSRLTSVTIPNSVTSIGDYAFSGCSGLTSVTIGNSVTSIGAYAFEMCTAINVFKSKAVIPPVCESKALDDINKGTCTLYVPTEETSMYRYIAKEPWTNFVHIEKLNVQGDSNGDDAVNEIDYSGVANYIMGNAPEAFDVEASDVDVNGDIDVRDYVGIANIITTGSIYGGASNNAKAAMSKGAAITAIDESDADNVIYVENVSGSKNSQVELSVRMRNASDIRGFQFDLYLPEGVTMANNAKASLSSDRLAAGDAHTLMVNEVSDGAVRFLCSSMNDESFAGGDGEIATLTINIANNVANGDYDVVVKNALMTETDISKSYEADNIKSTLTVLDQTGVETVTADNERRDGTIYTVGGQLMGRKATTSQLRKGVYIRNGKKIVVK